MKMIASFHDDGEVNVSVISDFEKKCGFFFPESYKFLLSNYDAIFPVECVFNFFDPIRNISDDRDISFYGYGDDIPEYRKIINAQDFDVYGYENVIAFGCSANGDHICFDYRHDTKTNNPKVVLMFHDEYGDDNKMLLCSLADSFEEFVDSLYKYEDDI